MLNTDKPSVPVSSNWGLWNMDAVAHTAMLPRGGELPRLTTAIDSSLGQRKIHDANGDELSLDSLLEKHDADGFLVLRDNQVAFCVLMEKYDIDLAASPVQYIEELKGSGSEHASIQDVLSQALAVAFKENYVDPDSDFLRYYAPAMGLGFIPGAQDVQPAEADIYGLYDLLAKFIRQDSANLPGGMFEYNSANADVIGWLIARLSDMPLHHFFSQHIWSKLGTYHDAASNWCLPHGSTRH
jgi:hypothetical protein